MEEDIKILENMIEKFKTIDEDTYEKEDLWTMCRYKHYKAIENLIARYKELEEQNKILKNKQTKIITDSFHEKMAEKFDQDFIPKSKIKEKIEVIKNRRIEDGECELALHGFQREAKIEALQELLK